MALYVGIQKQASKGDCFAAGCRYHSPETNIEACSLNVMIDEIGRSQVTSNELTLWM